MLKFRPHHFLCTLGFQGKGYSPTFVQNFTAIKTQLESARGDTTQIEVIDGQDQICHACPLNNGNHCQTQEKITRLDNNHKAALQLHIGETLTWGEAKNRIRRFVTLDSFEQICKGCAWKQLGTCRKALEQIKYRYPIPSEVIQS